MLSRALLFKLAAVLTIGIAGTEGAKFPDNQVKCRYGDSQCFIKVANEIMLSRGKRGYPELGLPPLDPLYINKISIEQGGNGPVVLHLDLNNAKIEGFAGLKFLTIQGLDRNIDRAKIEMKYYHPIFQMTGNYKASGKVLVFPVQGDGRTNITFHENEAHVKMLTKRVEKYGRSYMEIDKIRMNFEVKNAHMEFTNLFNGNKELGETFNKFVNDNWQDILKEIKPAMANSLAQVYKSIFNNVFSNIPYDEMFSE